MIFNSFLRRHLFWIAVLAVLFVILIVQNVPLFKSYVLQQGNSIKVTNEAGTGMQSNQKVFSSTANGFHNLLWKTPEQMAEFDKWIEVNGYTGKISDDLEYNSYSLETLQKLVDGGDVRAMLVLGKKMYTIPGQGFNSAKRLYRQAAIYGATNAINEIGILTYIHKIGGSFRPLSPEEEREAWLETLPWYELAKLRGDRWGLNQINRKLNRSSVNLSPEDWDQIRENGRKLYQTLQEQRFSLGLGEFDNSEPEGVKMFYDHILKSINPELLK